MVLQVLQRIVDAEGIDIDDAGLAAIARSCAGAFRDAIGALDQLATYCEGTHHPGRRAGDAGHGRVGPALRGG